MTDAQGTPLDAGDIVGERFQLIRRLGKGGMGTVWRARHLTLESDVALKLVDPTIARTSEGRARFKREAQAAAAIRSPHVVQILDHGVHDEIPFIVMELLEGESLAQRLDRGALSLAETTRVLVQVGRAVSRAHAAGVVHRDLKPDNIFLIRNDDEEIAKVLDFGIAKARFQHTTEDTTRTGAVLGTPHYMSPEQLRGDKALDYRADIWALGVIAYECVTQAKPFVSETFADLVIKICSEDAPPPSSRASVPESFDAWFFRATNRNPELRFASVREQIQALRGIVDPDFDPARGAPEPPQLEDAEAELAAIAVSDVALNTQHGTANTRPVEPVPSRTRRAWVVALAVLVLVVAGAAVATLGTTPRAEPVAADTPDAAALAEPSSTAPRELSAMVPHSPSAAALGSVERPGDAARAKSEQPVALDASAGAVQPASPPGPRPVTRPAPQTQPRPTPSAARSGQKPGNTALPAKPRPTGTGVDLGI